MVCKQRPGSQVQYVFVTNFRTRIRAPPHLILHPLYTIPSQPSPGHPTAAHLIPPCAFPSQAKTQHFHDGSDKLLRHMLAWSAFLPLGVRFIPSEDKSIAPAGDVLVRGVGVAGLQLQLLCMYWSLLSRRHGSKWYGPDFSAIYYILMNPFIGGAWGKALAQNLPELCRVLTALSMFAEFLAPLVGALAPATRWWRILPAVALTGLVSVWLLPRCLTPSFLTLPAPNAHVCCMLPPNPLVQ